MHNPGLNLPYDMHPGHDNIRVAHGWTAWWLPLDPEGNEAEQPEFKPLTPDVDGHRVLEGDASQCWFIRWRRMSGGIAQTVNAIAGRRVTARVPFHVWCSQSDDPAAADGELYLRVGIDPHGGVDPESDEVEWGNWVRGMRDWMEVALSTIAVENRVTVFIHGWNKWAVSHNDVYVDDVECEVEGVEPEPPGPPAPEDGDWIVDLRVTGTIRRADVGGTLAQWARHSEL